MTNGSLVANLEGLHPVFLGDGQQISTISCTHTQTMECLILLWDRNGQPIKQITSDQPLPLYYSTAFSPDGQYIATGSMEDIFLFKISDGMLIKTFAPLDILGEFSDDVNFLSFSNDGQTLISKSGNDSIRQWRISDGLLLKHERFDRMNPVTISQDGNLMATATGELVQIWNTSNGTLVGILKGHTWEISSLMFSPDNQTLIAGESGKAHLWRISDGALLQTVEIDDPDRIISISPDMQMLAATDWAGNISLWDASDGRLVYSLTGHTDFVTDIKFSIDKKTLVSASKDETVKVWNLSNGTLINTINIQGNGSDYKTDISPDGKMVAIVGRGFVPVQLWNTVDGTLLRTIEDYGGSIAFSPNGQLLTLIGSDEILKIYNISDMTLLHEVETEHINHLEHTPYTVFFPNGRALAIVSASGVVRVLGVPSENPLAVQPVNIPTMPSTPMAQSEPGLDPLSAQSTLPSPTTLPAMTAPAPTQIICSNFISQLQPNMEGTVVTSSINMRNEPATNKTIVGVIYAGEKVTIYDEQPICNEGFLWWKVKAINSGITGWVAEGTTEERWLSP